MSRVIVIGGGASGMMAAISAAHAGHSVTLLEQNEKLGKKIYITGKGRCNLTNDSDMETMRAHVISNPKFLYSSFAAFTSQDIVTLLENEGCPVKVERGNRVFPVSDHASDVTRALTRCLNHLGVDIRLNTRVSSLICSDGRCTGVKYCHADCGRNTVTDKTPARTEASARPAEDARGNAAEGRAPSGKSEDSAAINGSDEQELYADAVIVATGGCSYPSTGSTGDGYRFAKETGHHITQLRPSLVPVEAGPEWVTQLQGLSLRNVRIQIKKNGKVLYSDFGEMLFTHFGVSGPLILSASAILGSELPADLIIDLKPALTEEQLDERILRDLAKSANQELKNALRHLYPAKLVPVIIMVSGLDLDRRAGEVTRQERRRLLQNTKALTLRLTALRDFSEAVVTQGGISVKDVNPATLESRKMKGLYFAGEVLDVDALTGGYNLQIAWSTGWLAGRIGG